MSAVSLPGNFAVGNSKNIIMSFKGAFYLLLLFLPITAGAQNAKYSISGIVTDSISKEPLMGVYITTGKQGAQSDHYGKFTIKDIPGGEVTLNTMYYSPYKLQKKTIDLHQDTTVCFTLSEPLLFLDEVVVTGTRTEKRLSEAPVLTTIVKDTEIQKAGATSPLEALQDNIPGIVISPNAMGNNLRIKGLNSRYILFLVDGERMVSEGAGGNVNLDQIDVNNIKRIEVINGAASSLYGSNAVGAVINIITKEPVHRFEAGANLIAESHNTWRAKVDAGANLEKIKTRINAFRNSSDGFGSDGGAYAARYEDWGGDFKLGYNPTKRGDINITARYFRHETFNPSGSMNTAHTLTHTVAVGSNGGFTSADGKNKLRASINFDKYFDNDILEKRGNEAKTNNTASYISARAIDTYTLGKKWEFVGGLEYNHESNYAVKTFGAEPASKSIDDYNIFGQAQYKVIKNFDIIAGVRYTYNTQFNSAVTPKISLMYSIAGFTFRGGVGTAFRAPSIKELYYDFDHQGMFWVYGNPDLKAEKGLYSSLSAEYTKNAFNISVSGYYNNIDNKITQYDVINQNGAEEKYYKNVSSATLAGVDVNISYILFRELVLKGSYSFCDARDNSTGLQLESNVKHSATVSATWNGKIARSPFSLQIAGRITSPKLYQESVTDNNGAETVSISESKPYHIWKAVLVKPFRIKKHTLEITLKCDNIFNFKDASFINPGRQYLAGLRYAFK